MAFKQGQWKCVEILMGQKANGTLKQEPGECLMMHKTEQHNEELCKCFKCPFEKVL